MSIEGRLARIEVLLVQLLAAQGEPTPPPYCPDGDSPEAVIARCKATGVPLRDYLKAKAESAKAEERTRRKQGAPKCRP